ncbi:MAG: hypothetical protein AMXMBFR46_07410 [Acidimicrobiia bacterium]
MGPAFVVLAVLGGIVAGERAGPGPARALLGLALLASAVAVAVAVTGSRRGGRVPAGLVALCIAAACAASALTSRALDGQARSPLAASVDRREAATVDATLTGDPMAQRFSARAMARVDRARIEGGGWIEGGGRTVVVDASSSAAQRLGVLDAGDRVRLRGYFRPLDPFEARLRWRHAVGAFEADALTGFEAPAGPLARLANRARVIVLAGHRQIPEPQRALVAGFLLGDTSNLPDAVVADFRAAGLSHLVAVSGQNVAFVLALIGPLLRRGPRVVRLGAGLLVLVVFATMTRWEPSVLRAATMAACSMVALAVGRPTAGLRSLALAVIALLLVDPFLLHSVGFQLSCAASVGIAALSPAIAARTPGPRWFAESLAVTVGAQLAVAPVLLVVFGSVPLVSVPANLLAAPFAAPLTVLGLVGGVVGGVLGGLGFGGLGAVASFPAFACSSIVLVIAGTAARAPVAVGPTVLLAAVAVVAVGTFARRPPVRATWRGARPRRSGSHLALPPR